jgi:hypothetical protein
VHLQKGESKKERCVENASWFFLVEMVLLRKRNHLYGVLWV